MQSSTRPSQPPRPRRFEASRRANTAAEPKSHGPGFRREDKNMNTITNSSPRRATKASSENTRIRVGVQPRAPVAQSRLAAKKQGAAASNLAKPKLKGVRAPAAAAKVAPPAPPPPVPPLSPLLPLDPNCNEPSLPCLCCDGRSPQDNNSMFNHNHNNNNAISLRNQMRLQPPSPPLKLMQEGKGVQERHQASPSKALPQPQPAPCAAAAAAAAAIENEVQNADKSVELDNKNNAKPHEEEDEDDSSGDIVDDDDDDEDDDDTLVPSCCDGPPSLLDLSLSTSSSSSSSSTSISSCSDLESDCADLSTSLCSSHDQDDLATPFSPQEPQPLPQAPESHPPARPAPSLPLLNRNISPPMSRPALDACSPDEGYPSAPASPSSDYLGAKGYTGHEHLDSEVTKLGLLDFLESVGEFGKMERFSQVIQVAHWDVEGEQHWDVLRDRLDHLDRLEKVNREVKLAYITRLHEKDLDLGDFEEQDFSDVLDEMGNIDMSWKLYKGRGGTLGDSQEFSDAGVDLTAPSDCDEPLPSDSLTPSPVSPPPRPPKPPARHASVNSDLHTYINISRETTSIAVSTCPTPTFSTFSPNSSPTFSTFRCEKALPPSPPSIPPLPASQPIPYLTLYTAPLPPPLHTPTPPIPPPRKRHLARKEAQRLAALQAQQEKTPLSLPPPTTRPPPLPPPPTISVASSSPQEIPQPPPLPPPPSFHALDVEIRKLLMLAGLTQAELLKLSPELSVCVGGLEDEGGHRAASPKSEEAQEILRPIIAEGEAVAVAQSNKVELDAGKRMDVVDDKKQGERTTSFTEMARRRKRNTGLMSEAYFSTETFHRHSSPLSDSPPPPPPRPLPPIPPSLLSSRACTLSANSARPERFDWLIAFTPDTEALLLQPPPPPPALETTTSAEVVDTPKKLTSSSSGSSTGSGPKVTTFKELRFRNRNTSPPMQVITDPEPDPNIVTPDPDILYNLKWRREKKAGDGEGDEHQWEYTSQAQAFFMQPPPALTSMDALKEMLQRADEEGRRAELCAAQKLGCSAARDGNLWTSGEERGKKPREEEAAVVRAKEKRVEQPGAQVEVRGRADGGRTLESRTIVSSPPLSLAQSRNNYPLASPYFLHRAPAAPLYRPGYYNPRPASRRHRAKDDDDDDDDDEQRPPGARPKLTPKYEPASPAGPTPARESERRDAESAADGKINGEMLDSISHFDSLFCHKSERRGGSFPDRGAVSVEAVDCATPYKNLDVMLTHADTLKGAKDSRCAGSPGAHTPSHASAHEGRGGGGGGGGNTTRAAKELPPLPTLYLHHPKSCPLHRGAPPRLSPIGALSPPWRPGALPPGLDGSGLRSPLSPRSHTLPALAAPLYYPYLYPPIPPRAPSPRAPPPRPPKCQQAPPKPRASTVRSVSFADSVQSDGTSWMAEDVKLPVRRFGLSPVCLQEKKALVVAVSVAVEAILAQFSSSRTVVQKALSGDSSVNPALGRLVLQCLCPALHSLLSDGLKPHQCDVIAGRRPNSAWGLVQASTKPGPHTQAVYNLQVRVGQLPQLRQSKHRFNAFLFGLLNTKLLDFWLSHLPSCSDVLETFYQPSSFMRVSPAVGLYEELLLLLQPLSILTFNLDLLFQHHHLAPANHGPPAQEAGGFRLSPRGPLSEGGGRVSSSSSSSNGRPESLSKLDAGVPEHKEEAASVAGSSSPASSDGQGSGASPCIHAAAPSQTQQRPQLLWVQEKEIRDLPPPALDEGGFSQQAGQVLQEGWEAVLRLGGRLSRNLSELSPPAGEGQGGDDDSELYSPAGSDFPRVDGTHNVSWGFGRLFGASKGAAGNISGHTPQTRRPSQWLGPGVTALTRMVSSSSLPTLKRAPEPQRESQSEEAPAQEVEIQSVGEKPRTLRSVRTLCDHTAAAGTGSELSFRKGEELVVLEGVDHDWIRCRQGDREGLVPIGYTSLIM